MGLFSRHKLDDRVVRTADLRSVQRDRQKPPEHTLARARRRDGRPLRPGPRDRPATLDPAIRAGEHGSAFAPEVLPVPASRRSSGGTRWTAVRASGRNILNSSRSTEQPKASRRQGAPPLVRLGCARNGRSHPTRRRAGSGQRNASLADPPKVAFSSPSECRLPPCFHRKDIWAGSVSFASSEPDAPSTTNGWTKISVLFRPLRLA